MLPIEQIERVQARGNYSIIYANGRQFIAARTLLLIQQRLGPLHFVRIHRQHLVNLDYVTGLVFKHPGWWLKLKSGEQLPLARRSTEEKQLIQAFLEEKRST